MIESVSATSPIATPISTPEASLTPAEEAPVAPAASPELAMNLTIAFPPLAYLSAQDLATTLYANSDKALYNVTAYNGPVDITSVVYGSMLVSAAAPAPAPGPSVMPEAAPEAAAAPESSGAIESYSGPVLTHLLPLPIISLAMHTCLSDKLAELCEVDCWPPAFA